MNAIIGMAYLVRQSELSPRQLDHIRKIEQSGQHLLAILDDILDISKVEAGKLKIESIPFELENVINNVINVVSGKASAKGLKLGWQVNPDVPHRLLGDPLRLGQILINYANNAVKFTELGEVNILVSVKGDIGLDKLLEFEVTDSGIGLSAEQARRLFQSFEQADTSTTRQYGGTGLGLAISKGLAGLMGGSVGVNSQLGVGSSFWFTARVGVVADLDASVYGGLEPPGIADSNSQSGRELFLALLPLMGARILLVEDNDLNQQVATELLQMAGFEVDLAENGRIAIDKVAAMNGRRTPYDLVLMDLQMPVMDGLTATAEIRADPRNDNLPVAAMTANVMQDDRQRCEDAGMNGFVVKPIEPDELWRTLAQLIRLRVGLGIRPSVAEEGGGLEPGPVAFDAPAYVPMDIAGLDTRLGLRRVMGRETLYLSLLRKFMESQTHAMRDLEAALDASDWPLAERIAHTLKGVAGNIGATSLEAAAGILERGLHTGLGRDAVNQAAIGPKTLLDGLITALFEKLPAANASDWAPLANPLQVQTICKKLARLLAQQDFEAEEVFAHNRAVLKGALGSGYADLKQAIAAFNFDDALLALKSACARQNIGL
jgi:CheY-like chemotaxis protein